jgi:hypothetical protein
LFLAWLQDLQDVQDRQDFFSPVNPANPLNPAALASSIFDTQAPGIIGGPCGPPCTVAAAVPY